MNNPLISIAMATYNGEKYLKEQLDSIYNQTYKNIEVIVCDDCSNDNTVKILEEYKNKYGLKYFINKVNLGYVKNFEKAISLCNGDYIALSDQDDIWLPEKLEVLLNTIEDNLLIHSDASLINENGELISTYWKGEIKSHICFEDFLFSNIVTGCTVLFKKELLKNALPFPYGLAYHDWYLAILAAQDMKIKYLDTPLTMYRQHSSQDTSASTPNLFKSLVTDKILRLLGYKIHRQIVYEKHLRNLKAIEDMKCFDSNSLRDAILYFDDYINFFVHLKTFKIGFKYSKHIYFRKNFFFIKNIINDIVG